MGQKINADKEPVYKGILGPVLGNRRIICCDPCGEVCLGIGSSPNVLVRPRVPTVYFALVEITWVGPCRLWEQRYYADLANWPKGVLVFRPRIVGDWKDTLSNMHFPNAHFRVPVMIGAGYSVPLSLHPSSPIK